MTPLVQFLLHRQPTDHWQKIPWDDPDFSRRMLDVHLTQETDAASRRTSKIDAHVDWIHRKVLGSESATILDLGCGPGLYMDRLSELGHTCTGIDFSPASINYAKGHHAGRYRQDDLRTADFGEGNDLVMLIFGELNAFAPEEAQAIIDKAHAALKHGGKLLLEVSYAGALEAEATKPPTWFTAESGLFSDSPHLGLQETKLDLGCLVSNYYIVDEAGGITTYTTMHQIYTEDEYRQMLRAFDPVLVYPCLMGMQEENPQFMAILATK